MHNVKVPGVLWAIGIIVAVSLVHANEAYLVSIGVPPWAVQVGIATLIAILKGMELPNLDIDKALDVLDKILARRPAAAPPEEGMRSAQPALTVERATLDEIPPRPNKLLTWLVG